MNLDPGPRQAAGGAALADGQIDASSRSGGLARQLLAAARADLLDRTRRYSYLVTLAGTLYFGYLVSAGYVRLTIHGQRGVFNSAWVGTLTAVTVGSLLPLVGFYLVKNSVDRDRRTGVGEILAATPLPNAVYTLSKALSNFVLLASIPALLAIGAAITQLLAHEESHVELASLLAPMVLLALPPVAITAALAVLFETVTWLRGTLGNVVFFFLWSAGLTLTAVAPGGGDLAGFKLVEASFAAQLPAAAPGRAAVGNFSLNIGPRDDAEGGGDAAPPATSGSAASAASAASAGGAGSAGSEETAGTAGAAGTAGTAGTAGSAGTERTGSTIGTSGAASIAGAAGAARTTGAMAWPRPPRRSAVRWRGVQWTAAMAGGRLAWMGAAVALALLAAVPFNRFDPTRERRRRRPGAAPAEQVLPAAAGTGGEEEARPLVMQRPLAASAATATAGAASNVEREAPGAATPGGRMVRLVLAELRLMLRGRGFWWFAVAAGLAIAGALVPSGAAQATVLAVAWLWPLPLWSELGAREALYGTRPLILSAPLPPVLQCVAIWAAGTAVAAAAGAGVAARLLLAGDAAGLAAWLTGCVFIAALAVALGSLAGSPRPFEVVYLLLWYAGPMNRVAQLDYIGLSPAAQAAGMPRFYLALAAALLAVACLTRTRQARR